MKTSSRGVDLLVEEEGIGRERLGVAVTIITGGEIQLFATAPVKMYTGKNGSPSLYKFSK